MGRRNYLIEGVSGTGKTSVCDVLLQRGYQAIHGDRVLAYQGDPETGVPLPGAGHAHHIWDEAKVRALAADQEIAITFFCGGSRNFHKFIDVFDQVFVLEVDIGTLNARLAARPDDEFGAKPEERALIRQLHATQRDVPKDGVRINASKPLDHVVDAIVAHCAATGF